MDIAAMSMSMSQAKLQTQVSTAVLKLAMDTQKDLTQNVVEELLSAVPVSNSTTGHIDISV